MLRIVSGVVLALSLAGCAAFPSHGPTPGSIRESGTEVGADGRGYAVITVTEPIAARLSQASFEDFYGSFTDRRPSPDIRLGVGDSVSITIFEAAPGGLFTPATTAGARPGNFVEIPQQQIDRRGTVSVPFAGEVPAAGRTQADVQRDIEARLRNRAIEPQAVISIREQRAFQVSVLGEVNTAGKFTLNPAGERLLDVIARAGGPRYPNYETVVTLQRGGRRARALLSRLVTDPRNNVYSQPGDILYLSRQQRRVSVLGASGQNGQFYFDSETITLADALGKAGGLLDERADPAAVYLYRRVPRAQLREFGYDAGALPGDLVPTIYIFNLRDPGGFFLTSRVAMEDRDILFVANAPTVDFVKFLNVLRLTVNTGLDTVDTSRSVQLLSTNR